MKRIAKLYKAFFVSNRFFLAGGVLAFLFVTGYFFPAFVLPARIGLYVLGSLLVIDGILLFRMNGLEAYRDLPDKFSNGSYNDVLLRISSVYPFPVTVQVLDEIPVRFQVRNLAFNARISPGKVHWIRYQLRPVERGNYVFGALNLLTSTPMGLIRRRFRFASHQNVKVYPSLKVSRKYDLIAFSDRLQETGIKRIRRLGHSMEFDRIREYVPGDDYRKINWKATARKGQFMVNTYQEEKSQPVYNILDKGRAMKMPFNGMTLMDHAVNTCLVISKITLQKDDKAGLITYSKGIDSFMQANKTPRQLHNVLEALYDQDTRYEESSLEYVAMQVKRKVKQRSLLILYTNFETVEGMRRQLPYLRRLAREHLLMVVFFKNTAFYELLETPARNTEDIYIKTVAEKFSFEKKLIIKELQLYGIHPVLTTPENMNIDSINKYLELKARGLV